jgi:hypothetical protein
MPPNDMEAIAIHGYPTVPSPPPADGEAQRGGLLGSLLRSRRRRRHA